MIQAAKLSHSWEFIRRLPEGLDTKISENSLSQGQKQLISFARTLLSDPAILILDSYRLDPISIGSSL